MIDNFFETIKTERTRLANLNNNIFSILGIENLEIKHSNFLAYLFNPKLNLNIGKDLLRLFLENVNIEKYLYPYSFDDILQENVDIEVYRENNNIDIIINFVGYITILIENKIWSSEHDNQLFRYKNIICEKLSNPEDKLFQNKIKTPICIYLTPNGKEAKLDNDWVAMDYKKIIEILKIYKKSKGFKKLSEKQKMMICDYIEIVEEIIVRKDIEEIKQILNIFFTDIDKKRVMEEILEFVPNYKERANLIKNSMKNNNIEILKSSLTANAYINFIPNSFKEVFHRLGVNDVLFYFQLSNNSSFRNSTISTYFNFETKNQINIELAFKFFELLWNNKKLPKDFSKDRSLGYNIVFLSEQQEYSLDEKAKQSKIIEFFNQFEKSPKIKYLYDKLLEFEDVCKK